MTSAGPPPLPEERRIVTVLFADVTGFTAMSEMMDPEDVRDLIDACWQRLDAIVTRYGGRIDKHSGDGLMAVWGAPQTGDDDAANAVRAGLALQREFADFLRSRKLRADLGLRVGLNTGAVLAGPVGSLGEYTVIGDTVNLASRIEHSAEPGAVVIGQATYEEIHGMFDVQPLPPLTVKGHTGPLTVYRVEGEKAHPTRVRYRGASGLEMHLVGREGELKALMAAYGQAAARRRPTMVLIVGEAGMGKSRLMLEFARWVDMRPERPLLLSARALAQTAHVPFGLWRAVWQNHLSLTETEGAHKFARGVQELWGSRLGSAPAVEAAHVLGALIGLEFPDSPYLAALRGDPERMRSRAFALAGELFQRASSRAPVVLLLDDLHLADQASLDLVADGLAANREMQMLIVAGARRDLFEHHATWANHPAVTILPLRPLPETPDVIRDMFREARTLPEAWLRALAARANGNPYYIEELVRELIRQGAIRVHGETWRAVGETLPEHLLPDSLHALLQARLDSLAANVKAVAQAAAVIGRVFWAGAVHALLRGAALSTGLPTTPLAERDWAALVNSALDTLQQYELVFERVSTSNGDSAEREFIFKHHLLRDVAYEIMPKKYRRTFHRLAAEWLIGHAGHPALIAEHLEQAGEFARAKVYYQRAVEDAAARGAQAEAEALTARRQAVEGLATAPATSPL